MLVAFYVQAITMPLVLADGIFTDPIQEIEQIVKLAFAVALFPNLAAGGFVLFNQTLLRLYHRTEIC
jgi:hypothetical protein